MKRRTSSSPYPRTARGRRQPQTSCDFCRSKKLKCDRGQPCSNCTSRGIVCNGQPPVVHAASSAVAHSRTQQPPPTLNVLDRLSRLEDAVFGSSASPRHRPQQEQQQQQQPVVEAVRLPSGSLLDNGATELDYDIVNDSLTLDDCAAFDFRVAAPGEPTTARQTYVRHVDLPSRDDALALLDDYLDNSDYYVANILHPASVRATVDAVYTRLLRQGQKVDLGAAAFILCFCAAAAFFWDSDCPAQCNFTSEDHAAAQSQAWRVTAWDLIDQAQRSACNTLEMIQARLVLADLLYNVEGMTPRFRYIHSCARTAAYEAKLHLVDYPASRSADTAIMKERKRRIWWYIAGTDWYVVFVHLSFLGSMGGNADRIYAVNPKHMVVNYPRDVLDQDQGLSSSSSYRPWSEACTIHMNIRIRVAEICRATADALPLGIEDVNKLPYSTIAALDEGYQQILADFPPLDEYLSSPDPVLRRTGRQRSIALLSVHARRARMLRSLLPLGSMPARFELFRRNCLSSAEAVIDISSAMLSAAVDTPSSALASNTRLSDGTGSQRSPHRRGLIINHLFIACAILATDPSLRAGAAANHAGSWSEIERRRMLLANACRLVEKAGEKSPMALQMTKRLVETLRKHCVHGVREQRDSAARMLTSRGTFAPETSQAASNSPEQPSTRQLDPAVQENSPSVGGNPQQTITHQEWASGTFGFSGMTGIWDDFLSTDLTENSWDQLFADLDMLSNGI
ncbi:hypothetical protein BD289DRAFT_129978 [Coniella lustricola]|uniref:Zn(2)-C6 fungal-type domain-containing protein n=1 Tax=Coniella lustricola TaxID=2025994 RepID=A0A2T2ZW22_9PEZI|nr:hypothetical protein BD289DRAFT_129978 [Coniella lustricola]